MTEIHAKCPSCGESIQVGAVFCIKCGTNIRTGKKLVTEQGAPANAPAPRRGPPPRRSPGGAQPMNLKPVLWLLVLGVAAYFYLFQKDLLLQLMGRTSASSETEAPSPDAASGTASEAAGRKAGAAAAEEVNPTALSAIDLLDKIRTDPTNMVNGYAMLQLIQSLAPDWNNPDIIAGLKITYSLTRLLIGNENEGFKGLASVRAGYVGSTFSEFLDPGTYYTACPVCKGSPVTESVCSSCGGAARCKVCAGKGALTVEVKRDAIPGPSSRSKKFTPMGQANSKRTVCGNCGGTGRCPACDGGGKTRSTCESCKGKGKNLDRDKVQTRIGQAVEKTLERLSYEEKDLVLKAAENKAMEEAAAPAGE